MEHIFMTLKGLFAVAAFCVGMSVLGLPCMYLMSDRGKFFHDVRQSWFILPVFGTLIFLALVFFWALGNAVSR